MSSCSWELEIDELEGRSGKGGNGDEGMGGTGLVFGSVGGEVLVFHSLTHTYMHMLKGPIMIGLPSAKHVCRYSTQACILCTLEKNSRLRR